MQVISTNNQYASGFRRLIAFIIDHVALSSILSVLLWRTFDWPFGYDGYDIFDNWGHWSFNIISHNFIKEAIIIIYYALMESSKYQATFGKIVMGIKVVNNTGQRLDFAKAALRNISKILSGLILGLGYVMIVFDDRKQGLHDKLADTFVVKQ